jgi:RNA polymerase sigma-70 factor (ECF subfamily)
VATAGDATIRPDLTREAIRLARLVAALMPDEPEAVALLALTLLQDSRRDTRYDEHGDLVLLEDQDRAAWDRTAIDEALAMLPGALRRGRPGPYQLQAAIAALHAAAPSFAATDWAQIAALYAELARLRPSPVVETNRAVAVAMAEGPAAGLDVLDAIDDPRIVRTHLHHAARADLLRRLGRDAEAADEYAAAIAVAGTRAERSYLERRLGEVRSEVTQRAQAAPGRARNEFEPERR